ncbi:GntR family transcriptional regulator [Paenibacillus sp. HB172176]|uniref:GntR family transcriptional regulator n=1 Tax=Paenibacillus sp. HB172176 TaxID=2493690 RepID=UPI00143A02C0|nr:GntR family transcriptional regulator [Paenibacillus sp. HB172176]
MAAVTLKEQAYIRLRQLILDGEIEAGQFLTERHLVEMLGMSRTPIRSALERLDAEGLANYTPNKGLIVAELTLQRAIDLYDFRSAIECYVVKRLAQQTLDEKTLEWFESNLREQEQAKDSQDFSAFTKADAAFHSKLMELNGNVEIIQAIDRLQDKLYQVALRVLRKDRSRIGVSLEDHARIFACIRDGASEEAFLAMERHLEYGKRILIL